MRLMDTEDLPTVRAGPALLLSFNEMSYAGLAYVLEVFNHAHAVLGSVALIQVAKIRAGKAVATEAVLSSVLGFFIAGLNSAGNAGFRFAGVITATAGTCPPIPYISPAEPAIHPARRDQVRVKRISLFCSF